MKFELPRPKRDDFVSDEQYLKALKDWRAERRRFIRENSPQDVLGKEARVGFKKRKKYRDRKETQWRKEQEERKKQKTLDKFK